MTLWELLKLYKNGFCDDVSDNYIDYLFCIDFDSKTDSGIQKDFPYMCRFTELLFKKTDIDYINDDNRIVCKFSKIIDDNIDIFKQFIKDNYIESMHWIIEDDAIDSGELHYHILEDFNAVLSGATGEKANKIFCKLLESCK